MTPNTLPTGWERWENKERQGVNRGYYRAYLNTNRMDHLVTVSKRDYDHKDKVIYIVQTSTNGEWKSGGSTHERFESSEDEESIESMAIESAIDWMKDRPCTRDGKRDPIELHTDFILALRENGIVEQNDADLRGTVSIGTADFTSNNISFATKTADGLQEPNTTSEVDAIRLRIDIDGKESGLSYREYKERDSDGEVRQLHEPRNKSSLHRNIKQAAREIGLTEKIDIKDGGHQTHWDHSVGYKVTAALPDNIDLQINQSNT